MLIALAIIFQIIIFTAVTFALKKILSQNVASATRHIDEINQDYVKKDQEVTARLKEAEKKAQDIISQALNESNQLKQKAAREMEDKTEKALQIARNQSDEIMRQAENSKRVLISEIEERITAQSIDRACELIQYTLPDEFKRIVHAMWFDDLIDKGFSALVRTRVPQNIKEIKVISAFSLDKAQRESLLQKLKDISGHDLEIKEEVNPAIVAGIVINIDSLVLDGSLKNRIEEKAKGKS